MPSHLERFRKYYHSRAKQVRGAAKFVSTRLTLTARFRKRAFFEPWAAMQSWKTCTTVFAGAASYPDFPICGSR